MAKKAEAAESVFTKEQILKSNTFRNYRDILTAVLDEKRTYSRGQVWAELEKFNKKR